ncbi:MAG: exo-alpha-sialidase, partial [Verrucomicrobiia bacterium]
MTRISLLSVLTFATFGLAMGLSDASAKDEITYGPWRSGEIGGGGWIQNVVPTSDRNRFYSYVDVAGVFRSDDGGRTWRMLHSSLENRRVRSLVVDPRDSSRVIIANGSANWVQGLFLSTDAGETWRQVLKAKYEGNGAERATGFLIDRHPQKPDVLITASVDEGVWRSQDNGETWEHVGLQQTMFPADIRFDRSNGDRVWLCTVKWQWRDRVRPPGFFRSDDGGTTWTKLSDESPTEIVQDPVDPKVIYGIFGYAEVRRSTDGGESWEDFSQGLPVRRDKAHEPAGAHRFSALAAGPDFVLTASARGHFFRLDRGRLPWKPVERKSLEQGNWFGSEKLRAQGEFSRFGAALGSITVNPHNPRNWFFTDWFAVYQTRDAGATWEYSADGLEATVIHGLAQDISNPQRVHLGMADNGYFRSDDGGKTWTRFRFPGGSDNTRAFAVSRSEPGKLWAVGASTSGHAWHANAVFSSTDSGKTWQRLTLKGLPDMNKHRCNAIAVHPGNARLVYLGVSGPVRRGAGGVYRSEDGGQSWEWFSEGLGDGGGFFREGVWGNGDFLAVDEKGGIVAISRDVKRVYRLAPGSTTWEISANWDGSIEPATVAADPFESGKFYLAASRGPGFVSKDGGLTWEVMHPGPLTTLAVHATRKGLVAIGGRE